MDANVCVHDTQRMQVATPHHLAPARDLNCQTNNVRPVDWLLRY
jgi:hypothetical protein